MWSDGSSYRILKMKQSWAPTETVIVEARVSALTQSMWHSLFLADYSDPDKQRLGIRDRNSASWVCQQNVSGTYSHPKELGPIIFGDWYIQKVTKASPTKLAVAVYDDDRYLVGDYNANEPDWSSTTWAWVCWEQLEAHSKYDWILTRKYAPFEPTVSIGDQQEVGE